MNAPIPTRFPDPPVIGSQLFINRGTTPEEARRWVKRFADARFRLVRLFLIWDYLEPEPGVWDWRVYDAVFDTAAEHGIGVVPTLMSVSPPGWMLRTGGVQAVANLEDPEVLREGARYIRAVARHWRDHPALHSWILWNEASRVPPRSPETLERYRVWLRERFSGDVEAMNRLQFRRYADFSEVGRTREGGAMDLEFATFAENAHWLEFSVSELMGHLARIREVVREVDPGHPAHVNPHGLSYFVQHAGQSIWNEAREVEFLGCSSHPVWHSSRYLRERWTASLGVFADLMRAATPHPEGLFWVSELQGGATRMSAESADCPSPEELTRWMWAGIGAGARATVFWCMNWRDEGYEAGEWGLCRLDGSPSPRLEAATGVVRDLEARADWFGPARPWRPQVAILRSDAAERLAWAEQREDGGPANPRNPMRVADSATGAALALGDLGIETGYIEETELGRALDSPDAPSLLLVPGLEALAEGTLERLVEFVRAGGRLIADAAPGWKDPVGRIASWRFERWRELFGVELLDLESWQESSRLPADAEEVAPWWFRVIAKGEGNDTPPRAAAPVWRHRLGEGEAVLAGTWFFHRFLLGSFPRAREVLADWMGEAARSMPLRPVRPRAPVRVRHLWHPRGAVVVILDERGEGEISLVAGRDGCMEFSDGRGLAVRSGERLSVSVRADGVGFALFRFAHPRIGLD